MENHGTGCIPDKPDERDYKFEEVMGASPLPAQYNVLDELPFKLKVGDQNGSSSCVAQAVSKYAEILNYFDEKKQVDLSAKFIYSRIYQPQGGASIRDGIARMTTLGTCRDEMDPSYDNGNPPSEEYIRKTNDSLEVINDAKVYKGKEYRSLFTRDIENIKRAIYEGKGVVSGFQGNNEGWQATDGIVYPPANPEWGHCILLIGWTLDNKIIGFNSWSENWGLKGQFYVSPDYWTSPYIFSLWTLIDAPNKKNMEYVIVGGNHYLIYEPFKIALSIGDVQELTNLQLRGLSGQPVSKENIDGYLIYPGVETSRLKDLFNL